MLMMLSTFPPHLLRPSTSLRLLSQGMCTKYWSSYGASNDFQLNLGQDGVSIRNIRCSDDLQVQGAAALHSAYFSDTAAAGGLRVTLWVLVCG